MVLGKNSIHNTSHPGLLLKEVLKERRISQKDFARLATISPTHLNDVLNGRRKLSSELALEVEKWLGIPIKFILQQQATHKKLNKLGETKFTQTEETEAEIALNSLNEFIHVNLLLKKVSKKCRTASEKLSILESEFSIGAKFKKEFNLIAEGCFRKSAKNGLDERMIATWILLAKHSVRDERPSNPFSYHSKNELCLKISDLLHLNKGYLLSDLVTLLDSYGIILKRVEKVEKASIDGFSFFKTPEIPCIIITCRYDRIDNLAFTIMHELGHIFLKHTTPAKARINIDTRSINEESEDRIEEAADEFASNALIPASYWNSAPPVSLNPFKIQYQYSIWAERLQLNKWIVLGHLSHITGMYKFKSDETRNISGGKEVCALRK